MQRDLTYLLDILLAAQRILAYAENITEDTFMDDLRLQDAISMRLIVIGEASRRISVDFREAHPELPWQEMIGLRSKIVHEYDRIRLDIVWDVIQHDIPALIAQIEPLVPPDDSGESPSPSDSA